ncbi:MAG TPA: glutathione S-transferase family protein [Pseudolabrys sp.]|nr:glutathione S-transferase family protein [Pseudolabrys sp.]
MLKVRGRRNSSNVQKVMWAIGELGLDYERIDIGMEFGGNRTPEYLALNPNGLVPTMQDGDFVLWESNSIVRYLANRYGAGTIEPSDAKLRALANQWMDWQLSVFLPAHEPLFFGMVRTPPEKRDYAAIAQSKMKTIAAAKIFDAELSRHVFIAGDAFSMGDIPMGIRIYRFRQLVPERPPLPNIERWYAMIERRPAFHEHVGSVPLT